MRSVNRNAALALRERTGLACTRTVFFVFLRLDSVVAVDDDDVDDNDDNDNDDDTEARVVDAEVSNAHSRDDEGMATAMAQQCWWNNKRNQLNRPTTPTWAARSFATNGKKKKAVIEDTRPPSSERAALWR